MLHSFSHADSLIVCDNISSAEAADEILWVDVELQSVDMMVSAWVYLD